MAKCRLTYGSRWSRRTGKRSRPKGNPELLIRAPIIRRIGATQLALLLVWIMRQAKVEELPPASCRYLALRRILKACNKADAYEKYFGTLGANGPSPLS